jgi:hypothetical protein
MVSQHARRVKGEETSMRRSRCRGEEQPERQCRGTGCVPVARRNRPRSQSPIASTDSLSVPVRLSRSGTGSQTVEAMGESSTSRRIGSGSWTAGSPGVRSSGATSGSRNPRRRGKTALAAGGHAASGAETIRSGEARGRIPLQPRSSRGRPWATGTERLRPPPPL